MGTCRELQIFELFSIELCDRVVMDFLAAIEVRKFQQKMNDGMEHEQVQRLTQARLASSVEFLFALFCLFFSLLSCWKDHGNFPSFNLATFICLRGWRVAQGGSSAIKSALPQATGV